jgi:DNA (cytosine-5)-methyltransferase 1
MRFGSVCSGIEAASVAWHPLGWEAAWLSEIEPFPCAVLKHHYPDVPNHGDMTLLPEKILSGEVEAPDLFCGGTPCQAFSVAGLRNSLKDSRGNLSLTFVGIANAIDHVRSVRRDAPAIIFWENVPGVLNTKDNAFGCFLGALAGETEQIVPPGDKWTNSGCVFGPQRTVAWRVLDAQYFGVAQRRRRVFVVASARDDFDPAAVLFEFEGVRRDIAPSRQARKVTPTISSSGTGVSRVGFNCEDEWFIETPVIADCGVQLSGPLSARDYKDAGTDGMNKISAKMVPVVQELVGALDTECGGNKLTHQSVSNGHIVAARMVAFGEYSVDGTASAMKARDWKDATDLVAQPAYAIQGSMIGRNDNAGPQGDGINEELCFTQNTIDRHAVATPIAFPSTMSGTQHASAENIAPSMGAKNPMAVAFNISPGKGELKDDIHVTDAHVSKTIDASASNPAMHQGGSAIVQAMAVRRLTPVECERLQGFPDNYSNIPWRKAAESPDGPRYKALGNSWAVPVVRWIGKRIQERITT